MITHVRRLFSTALALAATGLAGCMMEGGTEIPNELTGKERYADGGAVAKAQVKLYGVNHIPGDSGAAGMVYAAETDNSGGFRLRDVPAGMYNVLVAKDSLRSYRDSVLVTGRGQALAPDTLRRPGMLVGRVRLQPDHDPRACVVQVLGTHLHVNVEKDGRFELAGLGAGSYRLRVAPTLDHYTPRFKEVVIRSGMADSLSEPIEPFYSATPVVTGLAARPGPGGTLVVSWNQADYAKADGYLVYRDAPGALLPSATPIARVQDTFFIDTVYSRNPRAGQHPFEDTVAHAYVYRVRLLDKGGLPGPTFFSAEAKAVPPSLDFVSKGWKRAAENAPFGARWDHSLVVFQDRLWMIGRKDIMEASPADIWSSADGLAWRLEVETAPFPTGSVKATVLAGRLWAVVDHHWGSMELGSGKRNEIWTSADGLAWTLVTANPAFPARNGAEILAHGDKLVILGGSMNSGMGSPFSDVWMSSDGAQWTQANREEVVTYRGATLSFAGKLWAFGGGAPPFTPLVDQIRSSSDGAAFSGTASPAGLLPRVSHSAAVHAGRMWLLAGNDGSPEGRHYEDVWNSSDGQTWTLIDSHAPFKARTDAAVVSFKGRLWVSGGGVTGADASELWYYEGD